MSVFPVALLQAANAGNYPGKREFFYPLKDKVLRKYGRFEGYDRQVLSYPCWRCHGTGVLSDLWGSAGAACTKCGGDGIWETRTYFLERWLLEERVFHIPTTLTALPEGAREISVITKKIVHGAVDSSQALRAALALREHVEGKVDLYAVADIFTCGQCHWFWNVGTHDECVRSPGWPVKYSFDRACSKFAHKAEGR